MLKDRQCAQCRRAQKKLFLKGDRCLTPKCTLVKRNYPPGAHGAKTTKTRATEYGLQLKEKQEAKRTYGLREKQFHNYFKKALRKKGETGEILLQLLETRLDNIIFRSGFAISRASARQLVNHGHFLVNGGKVNIPSFQVKTGQIITIKESSRRLSIFEQLIKTLENFKAPSWLSVDPKELKSQLLKIPTKEEINTPLDLKLIVEFYSR